jgi:integrase
LDNDFDGSVFAVAKAIRDSKLDSRSSREKLRPSGKPYFRSIDHGLHLGYRKGAAGGKWVMRRYLGDEKYAVETIGKADDRENADGVDILTFHQAQGAARTRLKEIEEGERVAASGPSILVKDAVDDYIVGREKREAKGRGDAGLKRDARSRLTKHVLLTEKGAPTALSMMPLATLTQGDLTTWREGLKMAGGSVQRTVNDFKAALNKAAKRAKDKLPPTIRDTIKDGLASTGATSTVARSEQVLPDADIRAIISAAWEIDAEGEWEGDLGRLVVVLAATGARFSQPARMTVADVQGAQKRLMVPVSRKGKGEKHSSHVAVRVGDDVIAALRPATAGRKGHEPLLLRPRWRQIGDGKWEKFSRGPWYSASELTRPWAAIVERAGLAPGVVPYAMRHSSIVRGLRAGLPVRLVAALHDTSSAMIEKHYAAYIIDAMDELAALAVVPLTTAPAPVVHLERTAG